MWINGFPWLIKSFLLVIFSYFKITGFISCYFILFRHAVMLQALFQQKNNSFFYVFMCYTGLKVHISSFSLKSGRMIVCVPCNKTWVLTLHLCMAINLPPKIFLSLYFFRLALLNSLAAWGYLDLFPEGRVRWFLALNRQNHELA